MTDSFPYSSVYQYPTRPTRWPIDDGRTRKQESQLAYDEVDEMGEEVELRVPEPHGDDVDYPPNPDYPEYNHPTIDVLYRDVYPHIVEASKRLQQKGCPAQKNKFYKVIQNPTHQNLMALTAVWSDNTGSYTLQMPTYESTGGRRRSTVRPNHRSTVRHSTVRHSTNHKRHNKRHNYNKSHKTKKRQTTHKRVRQCR